MKCQSLFYGENEKRYFKMLQFIYPLSEAPLPFTKNNFYTKTRLAGRKQYDTCVHSLCPLSNNSGLFLHGSLQFQVICKS